MPRYKNSNQRSEKKDKWQDNERILKVILNIPANDAKINASTKRIPVRIYE